MNTMPALSTLHPLWIIAATFIITMLPLIVGAGTSYLKISVVLSLLRSGLGLQQSPNTLVVMVLSLALSLVVMGPVLRETNRRAGALDTRLFLTAPSVDKIYDAMTPVIEPWVQFLEQHSGSRERETLAELASAHAEAPPRAHNSFDVLLPAFVITELKSAFNMGFLLLLPFLVLDLIVANVLAGLGMYMVSPTMVSLPLKLLLFVSVDGWLLLSRSLVLSYGG